MIVLSFKTLEKLKQTWLRRITCIFYSLNYDVDFDPPPIYMEFALSNYNMIFTDWRFAYIQ